MVLIYCETVTVRVRYVVQWIMQLMGCDFSFAENRQEYDAFRGAKICYHSLFSDREGGLCIQPAGLLEEEGIKSDIPLVGSAQGGYRLFENSSDTGFDIFSAVFFMISRYEEYWAYTPDKFGRFPAQQSLAFKNGFLEEPVVDSWIQELKQLLLKRFPELPLSIPAFKVIFTYDIDSAFKYRGRKGKDQLLAFGKDLVKFRIENGFKRLNVLVGKADDPWNIYQEVCTALEAKHIPGIFFFLAGKKSKYDRNVDLRCIDKAVFEQILEHNEVGVHPSFYSSEMEELFSIEKTNLEHVLGKSVNKSRQHFLKFRLPETYQELIRAGIREDYSMAFPDRMGFRAGTSNPFNFYDLKQERKTDLVVYPSGCMDATFINYLEWDAETMKQMMIEQAKKIKKSGGYFIPIFHNQYLETETYRKIHQELIDLLA